MRSLYFQGKKPHSYRIFVMPLRPCSTSESVLKESKIKVSKVNGRLSKTLVELAKTSPTR